MSEMWRDARKNFSPRLSPASLEMPHLWDRHAMAVHLLKHEQLLSFKSARRSKLWKLWPTLIQFLAQEPQHRDYRRSTGDAGGQTITARHKKYDRNRKGMQGNMPHELLTVLRPEYKRPKRSTDKRQHHNAENGPSRRIKLFQPHVWILIPLDQGRQI